MTIRLLCSCFVLLLIPTSALAIEESGDFLAAASATASTTALKPAPAPQNAPAQPALALPSSTQPDIVQTSPSKPAVTPPNF